MKACWNCGKPSMCPAEDLGEGWFKCADCGATWIEGTHPVGQGLAKEHDDATGGTKYKAHPLPKGKKAK